jgi:predicted enzyme related to lactoylglutathione lyase
VDLRLQCVVVDCHDPERLATFWSEAIGWRITHRDEDEWVIEPPEGDPAVDVAPDVLFGRSPDEKVTKNRLHFDLRPADQGAEVERLLGLGARHVDVGQGDDVTWVVLADPEDNEFCVLAPRAS